MHTCAQSGILLKADKPATPIDSTFLPQSGQTVPELIEVWDSFTAFGGHRFAIINFALQTNLLISRWHYLLVADLKNPYTVQASDLALLSVSSKVIEFFGLENKTAKASDFDSGHALQVLPSPTAPGVVFFKYFVIAPVLESGWVFFGEIDKVCCVQRNEY
jgi:hypothetical protein